MVHSIDYSSYTSTLKGAGFLSPQAPQTELIYQLGVIKPSATHPPGHCIHPSIPLPQPPFPQNLWSKIEADSIFGRSRESSSENASKRSPPSQSSPAKIEPPFDHSWPSRSRTTIPPSQRTKVPAVPCDRVIAAGKSGVLVY